MGKINFHFVNENVFNSGTKNEDHLYFVNKTNYVDLYKGSLPIVDPNVVKNGQNVSFGTIAASGNITAPDAILNGKSILSTATKQSNGLMSSDDKATLDDWADAKEKHLLDGRIQIGSAILSYSDSDDALKITFV